MREFCPVESARRGAPVCTLVEKEFLPFLLRAQNADGGWGYRPGLRSRVEPTSWALLALQEFSGTSPLDGALARGLRFLLGAQLPDGSWPAAAGQEEGCWVTSLACWALLAQKESLESLARGLRWLSEEWPGDARLWWRLVRRLSKDRGISAQDDSYSGWSWTPGTASWVEPTSHALIVLHSSPAALIPSGVSRRQELAEAMLYDRICPGGGWNCGNPMVYGVPGEPLVSTTVWALLALRGNSHRTENQRSLDWLERMSGRIRSPGSLALAQIGLDSHGRRIPVFGNLLRDLYERKGIPWSVPEVAWAALALSARRNWLNLAPTDEMH